MGCNDKSGFIPDLRVQNPSNQVPKFSIEDLLGWDLQSSLVGYFTLGPDSSAYLLSQL